MGIVTHLDERSKRGLKGAEESRFIHCAPTAIAALLLFLALTACDVSTEEKVRFGDSVYASHVMNELDRQNIGYRRGIDNSIYYEVHDVDVVEKVLDDQLEIVSNAFSIYDEELLDEFMRNLDVNGIQFELHEKTEGGFYIIIDPTNRDIRNAADKLFGASLTNVRKEAKSTETDTQ